MTKATFPEVSDTLTQRLRTDVLWHQRRGNDTIAADCTEAADTIERQAAEIESLRKKLAEARAAASSIRWR